MNEPIPANEEEYDAAVQEEVDQMWEEYESTSSEEYDIGDYDVYS